MSTSQEKEASHQRYVKNAEKVKARSRRWRAEHPDQERKTKQRWRAANVEKCRNYGCQYREQHRDEMKEYNHRYYENNHEKIDQRSQQWHENNPDAAREHKQRWREVHPDKARECNHQWCKKNPDKRREIVRRDGSKRRAAKLKNGGEFTRKEFTDLCKVSVWQCTYCGCNLTPETVTADHKIPLSRGGSNDISNITIACVSCNCSKKDKTPEEYAEWLHVGGVVAH